MGFRLNLQEFWQFFVEQDKSGYLDRLNILNNMYQQLIYNTAEIRTRKTVHTKPNPFLSHNADIANHRYRKETAIYPGLLYSEEVCFIDQLVSGKAVDIRVRPQIGLFEMEQFADTDLEQLREDGFKAFRKAGKYRYDSDVIRLNAIEKTKTKTYLTIQKALYSQQARSNLIVDYTNSPDGPSLRSALCQEYEGFLPPLHDERLAHTIGVTMLLFFVQDGALVPFLVPRSREVAVLNEGAWSDSASGAAEWPKDEFNTPQTFEEYILDDMYMELREELGLDSDDVKNILPLAIAREFIRAGKPQIFFIGFTHLSYNQLVAKMETTREKTLDEPYIPNEMYKMPAFRSPVIPRTAKEAAKESEALGIDAQSAASLFYAHKFFEQAGDNLFKILEGDA